jgi:hypothetical protein
VVGARSVVRAVPQGAWTAVCGLVLIASLGFAVVLGAGLSAWTGAGRAGSRPVAPVIAPPGSGLVVVPGGHPQVRHPVITTGAPPQVRPSRAQVVTVPHPAAASRQRHLPPLAVLPNAPGPAEISPRTRPVTMFDSWRGVDVARLRLQVSVAPRLILSLPAVDSVVDGTLPAQTSNPLPQDASDVETPDAGETDSDATDAGATDIDTPDSDTPDGDTPDAGVTDDESSPADAVDLSDPDTSARAGACPQADQDSTVASAVAPEPPAVSVPKPAPSVARPAPQPRVGRHRGGHGRHARAHHHARHAAHRHHR